MIAKSIFVNGVRAMTGLEVGTSSFKIGLFRQVVSIKNLTINNPRSFKDKVLARLPEVYIQADLGALFNGKVHLRNVRIDLAELVVVRNSSGDVNLRSLAAVKSSPQSAEKTAAQADERAKGNLPPFLIDTLSLKVGKVIYKDLGGGGAPAIAEYNIGIDETFRDVSDPDQLISIIVVRALMYTPVSGLAGFDLGSLQNSVSGMMAIPNAIYGQDGSASAQQAVESAAKTINNLLGAFGGKKK